MAILKKPGTKPAANSAKPGDRLPGLPKDNGGDGNTEEAPATPAKKPVLGTKKNPVVDSFAQKFNEAEASTGGGYIPPPPGKYQAIITDAVAEREEGGKSSAYFSFVIVGDDELEGKECRVYFNFTDENGDDMPGLNYFKSALAMCGWDAPLNSWEHMEEVLESIKDAQVWCQISVVKKGKWTNVYLDSVFEEQDQSPGLPS